MNENFRNGFEKIAREPTTQEKRDFLNKNFSHKGKNIAQNMAAWGILGSGAGALGSGLGYALTGGRKNFGKVLMKGMGLGAATGAAIPGLATGVRRSNHYKKLVDEGSPKQVDKIYKNFTRTMKKDTKRYK